MSDNKLTEAKIMIGTRELTFAQSMTLRVALESFAISLDHDGLGDDRRGKSMVKNYNRLINEIRAMIFECSNGFVVREDNG